MLIESGLAANPAVKKRRGRNKTVEERVRFTPAFTSTPTAHVGEAVVVQGAVCVSCAFCLCAG